MSVTRRDVDAWLAWLQAEIRKTMSSQSGEVVARLERMVGKLEVWRDRVGVRDYRDV